MACAGVKSSGERGDDMSMHVSTAKDTALTWPRYAPGSPDRTFNVEILSHFFGACIEENLTNLGDKCTQTCLSALLEGVAPVTRNALHTGETWALTSFDAGSEPDGPHSVVCVAETAWAQSHRRWRPGPVAGWSRRGGNGCS